MIEPAPAFDGPCPDPTTALLPWLERWSLRPDAPAFATHSSALQPVLHQGRPAMLKRAYNAEEQQGGRLMQWWDGRGAARVFEGDGQAFLMERAMGSGSLARMAHEGRDDEACLILCEAARKLHSHRGAAPPGLVDLAEYFLSLRQAAQQHGGLFEPAWQIAARLLAGSDDKQPLHGDLHHENVLDFGPQRGWLAIDPKRVIGARGFDYATLFGDPLDLGAELPGRLGRRLAVVAPASGLPPALLLQWIAAQQGLSAAWHLEDGEHAEAQLPLSVLSAALALGATHL